MTDVAHPRRLGRNHDALYRPVLVWEWPVRLFHWVNALCIVALFLTGIYIAEPVLTPQGESFDRFLMATMRQIHFSAGFVFAVAVLLRVYWWFFGNVFARGGAPCLWCGWWWRAVFTQLREYVSGRMGEPHLGHNALAGATYLGVILLSFAQVFTGFALYSESDPIGPMGAWFGWVIPLLGGSMRAHVWHHLMAWGFVVFVIAHVYIVVVLSHKHLNGLVSSIVSGYKFERVDGKEQEHGRGH